ncbi:ABC transporter permease [Alteribacter aurantiacus]|uniref:ABC transporter permease n=1 Tax=Alteribacter aurantiacus TaxID=254410 RepID=UPI000416BF34|nr:ABC transporter permease subunit [Alteribacter aurantiacus]
MGKLIQNEWMKIIRRNGTTVMIVLLFLIVCVGAAMTTILNPDNLEEVATDWQGQLMHENSLIEDQLQDNDLPYEATTHLHERTMVNEYHLEQNIEPLPRTHAYSLLIDHGMLLSIVTMFVVIIGAGIVSGEHSTGTIKLLLVRPVSRWRILMAKWVTTILFALLMTGALMIFTLLIGFIVFGFDFAPVRVVEVVNGELRDWHIFSYVLSIYSLHFVELIMFATLSFMIGTTFRNQALAVGISLVAMFMGGQMVYLLRSYEWAKYLLFANTSVIQFFEGAPIVPSLSVGFSVAMLLMYFSLFHILTFWVFTKRDVAD